MSTYRGRPTAPPIFSVWPTLTHTATTCSDQVVGPSCLAHTRAALAGTTMARHMRVSQPISTAVPRATMVSNQ